MSSSSSDLFSLSSSSKTLHENHWASYFHQASLGTHLSCQFFTNMSGISNVQHLVNNEMLPWENIPIRRNQEAYRMPSVGSIFSTLEKNSHQDQVASNTTKPGRLSHALCQEASFPLIDPLDICACVSCGTGLNYIPMHQIQCLENCAATLLMGCSGSLKLNGCYVRHGPALSYLLAGSPVIIGNLWEVTDNDINRFAKAMLVGWLEERSRSSHGCAQCKVADEFEASSIRGRQGNVKKVSRKKLPEACGK